MHALMFIVVCVLWGHSFLLMKMAEPVFGALGVGAWRQVMGAATLAVFWVASRKPWPLGRKHIGALLLLGGLGYALPFALQFSQFHRPLDAPNQTAFLNRLEHVVKCAVLRALYSSIHIVCAGYYDNRYFRVVTGYYRKQFFA